MSHFASVKGPLYIKHAKCDTLRNLESATWWLVGPGLEQQGRTPLAPVLPADSDPAILFVVPEVPAGGGSVARATWVLVATHAS